MFKRLAARVARAVSGPSAHASDLAGAKEANLRAAAPFPMPSLRSGHGDGQTYDQHGSLHVPGPSSDSQHVVDHPAAPGPRSTWSWLWGQRKELAVQQPQPTPKRSEIAVLDEIIANIDMILADQQKKSVDQDKQKQEDLGPDLSLLFEVEDNPDVTVHIEAIRKITGYTFKDPDYVRGAIFKSGLIWKGKNVGRSVQKQLALLGDKFLEFGSLSANFGHTLDLVRPHAPWLMSNRVLHYCAQRTGLPQMLAESGYASRIQGDCEKGFGTLVEAIIGAVYEDSGRDGAVTSQVMAKLLGTSMVNSEVSSFYDQHSPHITVPARQFWWEDIIKADVLAKLDSAGRADQMDAVMAAMANKALSENNIRNVVKRRLAIPKPASTRVPLNSTRAERVKTKRSLLQKGKMHADMSISGEDLRAYIDYVKERQLRFLKPQKSARVEAKLKKRFKIYQEYINKAERHYAQGTACRTL